MKEGVMSKLTFPTRFVGITNGYKLTHTAIDLAWNSKHGGKNADIYASGDGVVTSVRDGRNNTMVYGDSGNYVTIKYGYDYEFRVCHLLKGSITVKKGDAVTRETVIGKIGNSGYCGKSRGNHVHFIVWYRGKRVDPLKHVYVNRDNVIAKSNSFKLLYDTDESDNADRDDKVYVMINARSGVWCRKGAGFKFKKYKAIPYGTKCELLVKNVSKISGYYWDKIIYNGKEVFVPNNWNKYL